LGEGEYDWAEPVGGKVMKYRRPITLALSAALVVAAALTTTTSAVAARRLAHSPIQ
jgi:hypothetical protein